MNKQTIRKRILSNRDQLSETMVEEKSRCILEQLNRLESVASAQEIYTYVSFGTEVDTLELIRSGLQYGKKIFVPRIIANGMIEFYKIQSLEQLVPGKFGILEPISDEIGVFGERHDQVMIMPGVAFDYNKNRIGYGGGYYDRFLEKHDQEISPKIALCYELQMIEALEPDEYDKKVDFIVTEQRIY